MVELGEDQAWVGFKTETMILGEKELKPRF